MANALYIGGEAHGLSVTVHGANSILLTTSYSRIAEESHPASHYWASFFKWSESLKLVYLIGRARCRYAAGYWWSISYIITSIGGFAYELIHDQLLSNLLGFYRVVNSLLFLKCVLPWRWGSPGQYRLLLTRSSSQGVAVVTLSHIAPGGTEIGFSKTEEIFYRSNFQLDLRMDFGLHKSWSYTKVCPSFQRNGGREEYLEFRPTIKMVSAWLIFEIFPIVFLHSKHLKLFQIHTGHL